MYPFVMRILTKPVKTKNLVNAVIPVCPCTDPLCLYLKPTALDETPRGVANWKLYSKNLGATNESA